MQAQTLLAKPGPSDHEAGLWRARSEGSAAAREELFALYTGLARRIARRHFRNRDGSAIEYPDLCQLAFAGLLEAIDGFDPDYGVSFARYAERRITGSVRDGLRHASEVHEQVAYRQRVRRERARSLAGEDVEALTSAEALDRLVDAAVGLALGFLLEDSEGLTPEAATDRRQPSAYDSLAWKELLRTVAAEVDRLPERERLVVRQHYLEGVDFDHLGALMRVSRGRVSQLHRAALMALKSRLNRAGHLGLDR